MQAARAPRGLSPAPPQTLLEHAPAPLLRNVATLLALCCSFCSGGDEAGTRQT
jgi:hypothetical protein